MNHYRRRKVFRSVHDKKFAGVCGGFAEYFDVSSFWVRVGTLLGMFSFPQVFVVAYIVCCFIMPKSSAATGRGEVPPLPQVDEDPFWKYASTEAALNRLNEEFDTLENQVRGMEDYVTSKEFYLKKQFESLEKQ